MKLAALLLIALTVFATAQNKEQGSKPDPAPEVQRLAKMLLGEWTVDEDFAPGGMMPKGGRGTGHSVIEPGLGGFSLIEDFVSNSPAVRQHNIMWWDRSAQRFMAIGCDDLGEGCSGEDLRGQWEGNEVVWQFTFEKDGKTVPAKIIWVEKDSRSFAATMYIADTSGTFKRDWTFLHIRVK